MRVTPDHLRDQIAAILTAWGMPAAAVAATAEVMLAADLAGIDSHGVNMLTLYDRLRRDGQITLAADVKTVRENSGTALIDGGGGLGHYPGSLAMNLAIAKAKEGGSGIVAVRHSHHYGAAGIYALRAAEAGLIGCSMTATFARAIVPTFGAEAMFGTNPIAFAAPTRRHPPFLLDMATSTAAAGKLKLALQAGKPIPAGWALGRDGTPTTDPAEALATRLLSPLGGSRELGGHKGYGLAMMVEILSTVLSGAAFVGWGLARHNVGHFFLALDPASFREPGAFEADLDAMIDALRATKPLDPAQPVLIPGDPEHRTTRERRARGIPLAPAVLADLERLAYEAGVAFTLVPPSPLPMAAPLSSME
ncbi:MAG TPA: Ldh family oxidoreductase [Stellaceae bacterium]|nr:Ldh family oxidoreductase [Stellaceae bacterium]